MTSTGADTRRRPGARALLRWYEPRRSAYPWRGAGDPYLVLVSEVMLQQTQANRVVPAFERFVSTFPSLRDLADAPMSEVVQAWAGLGYNRRAVALARSARELVEHHAGRLPSDPGELRRLPGVGPYTAAAVASIAFGARVAAIDTNVRRVVARVFDGSPVSVSELAERWVHPRRPGDWNQALMDLGRELCRPTPRCAACPLRPSCASASRPEPPGRTAARRQTAFRGSFRQLRGAIVRELRRSGWLSLSGLASVTGAATADVGRAVAALADDGLVDAGPAGLRGAPTGRVRLPA